MYLFTYVCNIMCQKSHVSTKYAQTFATSALLTHTLFSTCKESGIAQHKSNNILSMLCLPSLSYLQDNTRANASAAAAPSVSYPCGRSRTLIRNAFGTSLSVLSCFCLLILFRTAAGLSLSRFVSFSAAAGAAWAWHCVGCSATRVCFFPRLRRATTVRLNFVRVLRIVLF